MEAGPIVIPSQERKQGCSESSGVLAKSGKGEAGSLQTMLTFLPPPSDANLFTRLPLAITATMCVLLLVY